MEIGDRGAIDEDPCMPRVLIELEKGVEHPIRPGGHGGDRASH
jgi:hypothetical protein